jgi:hypothetical protein
MDFKKPSPNMGKSNQNLTIAHIEGWWIARR